MSERAAQRRAAWETVVGPGGVLAATQVAGDSLLATIAGSALFTVGFIAFAHAGVLILQGLHAARSRRDSDDE